MIEFPSAHTHTKLINERYFGLTISQPSTFGWKYFLEFGLWWYHEVPTYQSIFQSNPDWCKVLAEEICCTKIFNGKPKKEFKWGDLLINFQGMEIKKSFLD